jgi:hypothetical protein
MKAYEVSGCIDPRFLYLGTGWIWVVNFTPRSLYSLGKSPLDRRRVDHVAGLDDVKKGILDPTGTQTPTA